MKSTSKFSPEVQERAVRMVVDAQGQHDSQWAAIECVASKIGCTAETVRRWVRQHERNISQRDGLTSAEAQCIKKLERENRELRRANEKPEAGQRVWRLGGARLPAEVMRAFVDQHRDGPRGRADLPGAADCLIGLQAPCRAAAHARVVQFTRSA